MLGGTNNKMNELKTGALVEFSMLAPVIIAGEDTKQWGKIAKRVGNISINWWFTRHTRNRRKAWKAAKKDKKK